MAVTVVMVLGLAWVVMAEMVEMEVLGPVAMPETAEMGVMAIRQDMVAILETLEAAFKARVEPLALVVPLMGWLEYRECQVVAPMVEAEQGERMEGPVDSRCYVLSRLILGGVELHLLKKFPSA